MRIAYGHRIISDDDAFLKIADEQAYALRNGGPAGGTLVDLFPFLQHLPSWFPGTYYANFARTWRHIIRRLHDHPFEIVQRQMAEGTAEPSFLSTQLETFSREQLTPSTNIDDIKAVAGVIYAAGVETTWSSMAIFLLAMVLHPECQIKAQEELDAVIGTERLPEFSDRKSLPYVECVVQESLRWYSAAPLGVPHLSSEDDVYRGMFIPKGSLIVANTRGISRDDNVYADPHDF